MWIMAADQRRLFRYPLKEIVIKLATNAAHQAATDAGLWFSAARLLSLRDFFHDYREGGGLFTWFITYYGVLIH